MGNFVGNKRSKCCIQADYTISPLLTSTTIWIAQQTDKRNVFTHHSFEIVGISARKVKMLNQIHLLGAGHSLGAAVNIELAVDIDGVRFGGSHRNKQLFGNFPVGVALGYQLQHL